MTEVFPLSIASAFTLPLTIYTSVPIATMRSDDGQKFTVRIGLTKEVVEQLKTKSEDESDTELHEHTKDKTRFGGAGSYEQWYAKGRAPFVLVDEQGELAALAWYGPSELPDDVERVPEDTSGKWDTAGYRGYAPYRGKGLTTPFIAYTLRKYEELFPKHRLWIETDINNAAGRHVFQKVGFVEYGPRASNGRILMIKER